MLSIRAHCSVVSPTSFWNCSDFHQANDCAPTAAPGASNKSMAMIRPRRDWLMRKPLKKLLLEGIRHPRARHLRGDKVLRLARGECFELGDGGTDEIVRRRGAGGQPDRDSAAGRQPTGRRRLGLGSDRPVPDFVQDRKSTRLNSSHVATSYA